ncbi:phage tail sheath family protein [Sorangium sp. So ce281]|uniref:phage tail sheath family protein n=1 Tax=Sorangium sp. So ce281 TaxID=3133293 RepID=UPI003F5F0DC7
MPVPLPFPGVQIQEIPAGVRAIVGGSTSVTAFVGRALRGPKEVATRCFSFDDFARKFGGLWADSPMTYAVYHYFQNGGTEAVIVRLAPGANRSSADLATGASPNLTLEAASEGAWGSNLRVTVTDPAAGSFLPAEATQVFTLTVREVDPAAPSDTSRDRATETFINVSVSSSSPRYVKRVLEQQSSLVRVKTDATQRPTNVANAPFSSVGDGSALAATDYDNPGDLSFQSSRRGIYALDAIDTVNLLCLPPPARTVPQFTGVWTAAASYCDKRFTMLLVDPPASWTTAAAAAARTGLTSLTSKNAAFYFPLLVMPDPLAAGRPASFAPCGAVAGVIARTDGERGLWKAPAGQDAGLRGVDGFSVSLSDPGARLALTDAQCGALNPAGVNALRPLGVAGSVVWGARTAQGADVLASEWKYLSVRRLALHIEQSLKEGTRWAVFEPNDAPLWSQLRLSIGAFMHQLFRRGAFKGARSQEAYFVKCDAETTTPADQDRGIVNVIVGFAPLKPAEFVILQFQQITRAIA